ncbi:DUF370 domain-containing protein [Salicibibacter halophilus]|uniref:Putative regulatory protein EPH95_01805 n=1 Tax=Salicibibacter halophilus TaxID=2502791 RepID=A0A514LDZ8_9BACI|nr:extracellular matrix/biofilm biosynthesis regulator RemA family protein [Salicibibacter halophilus]QDI90064.1 DUF370 domain-containing protein [Salicibibacter halophilus]
MRSSPIDIGFGNITFSHRIVAIDPVDSAPVKRMVHEARNQHRLIDATNGRKTRSIIRTNSDHILLSTVRPETIARRLKTSETTHENPK